MMPNFRVCCTPRHDKLPYSISTGGSVSLPRWKPPLAAEGLSRTIESSSCGCFVESIDAPTQEQHRNTSTRRSTDGLATAYASSSYFPRVTVLDQPGTTADPQSCDPLAWQHSWPGVRVSYSRAHQSADARFLRSVKALTRLTRRKVTYDAVTRLLAAASVLPSLILAVQPLCEASGSTGVTDAATVAAASVSWQGPLRDMFSFTVLLSVFIGSEPGAAAAAAVCAAGGAIALATGPSVPPAAATATAAVLTAAAVVTVLCAANMRSPSSSILNDSSRVIGFWDWAEAAFNRAGCSLCSRLQPEGVLRGVQQALGVLGGGLLFQFLCTARSQGVLWLATAAAPEAWLPPVAAGAAAVILAGQLLAPYKRSRQVQEFSEDWPAWSATLLLILQPLQQLVTSALQPLELLPDVSSGQQLLLVFACGLMVPRALLLGELMWFTGTGSGAMLAAAQLGLIGVNRMTRNDVGVSVMAMAVSLLVILLLLKAGWHKIAQVRRAAAVTAAA